jgi:hypothetical protein
MHTLSHWQERNMTKRTITRTWITGVVVILIGGIVSGISAGVWLAQAIDFTGPVYLADIPYHSFWSSMTFVGLGGIVAVGGLILKFAAWVGALLNSGRLAHKTWFRVLLWGGIIGIITGPLLGLGELICSSVTVAYLIDPSDGLPASEQRYTLRFEQLPITLVVTN